MTLALRKRSNAARPGVNWNKYGYRLGYLCNPVTDSAQIRIVRPLNIWDCRSALRWPYSNRRYTRGRGRAQPL